MKYYFDTHDGRCYQLQYWKNYMLENGLTELELFEAQVMFGSGLFSCTHINVGCCGEVGEGCGKECEYYKPRNGKNGRCRYSGYVYEQTDKSKTLKI